MLALGVNQWRENINNKDKADTALNNIKSEIESNLKTLDYIYKNNKSTIAALQNGNDDSAADQRTYIPGLQLQEIAWQTMLNTGINNFIDYEVMLKLSSSYGLQNIYKQTAKSFVDANLSLSAYSIALGNEVNRKDLAEGFGDTFLMLNELESQLIESYKTTLSTLNSRSR